MGRKTPWRWMMFDTKTKLIISIVLVSMIPLLVTQFIMYRYQAGSIMEKLVMSQRASIEQTAKLCGTAAGNYTDTLINMLMDDDLVDNISTISASSQDADGILATAQLKQRLSVYCLGRPGIYAISYFPAGGDEPIVVESGIARHYSDSLWARQDELRQRILDTALESNGPTITEIMKDETVNKTSHVFHIANSVVNYSTLKHLGALVVTVDEGHLHDLVFGRDAGRGGVRQDMPFLTLLIDREGDVVSAGDSSLIQQNIGALSLDGGSRHAQEYKLALAHFRANLHQFSGAAGCTEIPYGRSVLLTCPVEDTGWRLVTVLSEAYMYSEIVSLNRMHALTIILTACAILVVALALANNLSRSASRIVRAMEQAKDGNLDIRVGYADELEARYGGLIQQSRDEMLHIAQTFNLMMSRIARLAEELRLETARTAEAVRSEKDAEIKALTAQINPHFLYNTLDAVNWAAIQVEQYEISRMLTSLSAILRMSISDNNRLITLREEQEWLKKYIYLRQCANDNFSGVVYLDDGIAHCRIHKLLVQPLVENAISHGFRGFMSGGTLVVEFRPHGDAAILVVVRDNGQGIREEVLQRLHSREDGTAHKGLGLDNILSRLQLYYGTQSRYEITSSMETGTEVKLYLPRL